jgi:hypothetical protein
MLACTEILMLLCFGFIGCHGVNQFSTTRTTVTDNNNILRKVTNLLLEIVPSLRHIKHPATNLKELVG